MARHLLLSATGPISGTWAGAVAAFMILCVFAVAACVHGSGGWRRVLVTRRRGGGEEPVISIHQVQPGLEGDVCLWQRSILMGEKCQLPDFSGAINYDSAGNIIKKPSIYDELKALK